MLRIFTHFHKVAKTIVFPFLNLETSARTHIFFVAIVIDHQYIGDDYKQVREAIEEYLIYAKREILKHGGVNIQWFSWTTINVKRGN